MIMKDLTKCFVFTCLFVLFSTTNIFSKEITTPKKFAAIVNGIETSSTIEVLSRDNGEMLDAEEFARVIGASFLPSVNNTGFSLQLGKRFSSFGVGLEYGSVQTQILKLNEKVIHKNGAFWVSPRALERAVNGKVEILDARVSIAFPKPQQIGDIIPQAKALSKELSLKGFTIGQGAISLINPIDFCLAKLTPDANANNGSFPYYSIQVPAAPANTNPLEFLRVIYQMGRNEALIIIGKTPPECDYFSYRSYLVNMCMDKKHPEKRLKIYTQLGDPINNYNLNQSIMHYKTKSPDAGRGSFKRFFVIVSTANEIMYDQILEAAKKSGLMEEDIFLDVLNPVFSKPGNKPTDNVINFLHRVSIVKDRKELVEYNKQPTLEVLRVSATEGMAYSALKPLPPRKRGSGINENHLQPIVDKLHQKIISKYSAEYNIRELDTNIWLGDSGEKAIEHQINVLGETRDTLYRKSGAFKFGKDTVVLVYGVNHKRSNKSVYSNVSVYGTKELNGIGSVTNYMYDLNVTRNFPELNDIDDIEQLYVWKFARTKIDEDTFVINVDAENNLRGFDYDETVFVGFRSYIDPTNIPSLIGPSFDEIIPERVLVMTPKK